MREAMKRAAKLTSNIISKPAKQKRITSSKTNSLTTSLDKRKKPALCSGGKHLISTDSKPIDAKSSKNGQLPAPQSRIKRKTTKAKQSNAELLLSPDSKPDTLDTPPSCTAQQPLLVSLGTLHQGTMLRRPSEHVKSPYVADVQLDEPAEGDGKVIVHAPMLDLGGLLKPGCVVRMSKSKPGAKTKTSHAIKLVQVNEPECGDSGTAWIGAYPILGNTVARALLEGGHVTEAVLGDSNQTISKIKSEVKMPSNDSSEEKGVRSDFVVNDNVVVEVKCCVCADYQKHTAPLSSKKDRYYTVVSEDETESYQRTGLFPIGRRAQNFEDRKVVSERCIKHLRHLSKIATGEYAQDGYTSACLLLIVNRADCKKFRPCREACPMFAEEFAKAVHSGVRVVVARIVWNENGEGYFGGLLPVEI